MHQCPRCFSIYDAVVGEPESDIAVNTLFKELPQDYHCPLCETLKDHFKIINKASLMFAEMQAK